VIAASRKRGRLNWSVAPNIGHIITIEDEDEPELENLKLIVIDDDRDEGT